MIYLIFEKRGERIEMTVALIITSITSMVLQNGLFNNVCKKELKTAKKINSFNVVVYAVCIVTFGILLLKESISFYTVALGLIFGIVTALGNLYKMLALSTGPMHITLLVTTASMIIPTMSGVFFGEKFSFFKLCAVIILVGFIYISLNKSGDSKFSGKWLLFCALAFLSSGTVGVLQKVHQNSVHKGEVSGFLFVAFICSLLFCVVRSKGEFKITKLGKSKIIIGIICGACTFAMNYINLMLSGILPSQLFFPLINGSAIVLSSVMSVVIFKEKFTKKQLVGLIGGICSLIAICLVP